MLQVDQSLQHLPHHAEMVALTFELTLEVYKIGGGGVEALGEQPAEKERDLRVRLESASSNTKAPTGEAGLRVAVWGRFSSTDISPNIEPVSPRSTSTVPPAST